MTPERERLVLDNMRLVPYVLNELFAVHGKLEPADMCQDGYIALIRAAETYDMQKCSKFSRYAIKCIKNAMYNHVRYAGRCARDAESLDVEIDVDGTTRAMLLQAPDRVEETAIARLALSAALSKLRPRQRDMVRRKAMGYTYREIGAQMGLSRTMPYMAVRELERLMRDGNTTIL